MRYEWQATYDSGATTGGMRLFVTEDVTGTLQTASDLVIREATAGVWTDVATTTLSAANSITYSYKVEVDSAAGLIHVYRGGVLQVQWTDSTPLSSGDSIALTTESSAVTFDDVTVTQLPKTLLYIHTNHLGSVTVLTYGNDHMTALHGKPVPTTGALYLPFGAYRLDPNAKVTNYGFTGHVEIAYIKLVDMQARWYMPELQRFINPDTIVPDPTNPKA